MFLNICFYVLLFGIKKNDVDMKTIWQ